MQPILLNEIWKPFETSNYNSFVFLELHDGAKFGCQNYTCTSCSSTYDTSSLSHSCHPFLSNYFHFRKLRMTSGGQSCQERGSKFLGNASHISTKFPKTDQRNTLKVFVKTVTSKASNHTLISKNTTFPHQLLWQYPMFPRWKETPHNFHVSLPGQ